jgi:hypothetical protein
MAVTHNTAVRSAIANEVLSLIDADAAPGTLIFRDDAVIVATLILSYPAGTQLDGELTFDPITSDFSAVAGTIDNYVITDNSGTEILYGSVTVTGGGGDITLSNVIIDNDDTVGVTSLIYVAPA